MSLILDALKRSEQERQELSREDILAEYANQPDRGASLVPWMVGAIFLLNLAVVAWLLLEQPWRTTNVAQPAPLPVSPAVPAKPAAAVAPAVIPQVTVAPHADTLASRRLDNTGPAATTDNLPQRPLAEEQQLTTTRSAALRQAPLAGQQLKPPAIPQVTPAAVTAAPATPATPPVSAAAAAVAKPVATTATGDSATTMTSASPTSRGPGLSSDVLRLDDIPDVVRIKIQALEINAHVYSETVSKRFVLVNLQKRREGDALGDYTLEQILPNGLVINYGEGRTLLPLGQTP